MAPIKKAEEHHYTHRSPISRLYMSETPRLNFVVQHVLDLKEALIGVFCSHVFSSAGCVNVRRFGRTGFELLLSSFRL